MKIRLVKPYFTTQEVVEVLKTLDSGMVAQGPRVEKFEKEFAEYCGAKHAIAVNSCTSGLYLSLLALGVGKGDKVIVPDFTFVATGNAVLQTGASVDIVDVDKETFCMDVGEIEDRICHNTKAIIPVHALGHPANIPELIKISNEYNLNIIEDAASGVGSMIGDKKVGSFGNISCFSLQGRKIITTGEGGIITVNDNKLAERLRSLRSQGAPHFQFCGFSCRLSDIQACIGSVQLGRIDIFIERRRYLASLYNDLITDAHIPVDMPICKKGYKHTYQAYVVLVKNRDKVIKELGRRGIESSIGTHSLSSMPLFENNKICSNGKSIYKDSLALPIYHELTEDDIEYVVGCLKEIVDKEITRNSRRSGK